MATSQKNEGFIPIHGGYRNLITYQKSEIIFDGTKYFAQDFLINMTAPLGKWNKRCGQENKI
jgi:hypothetical protein